MALFQTIVSIKSSYVCSRNEDSIFKPSIQVYQVFFTEKAVPECAAMSSVKKKKSKMSNYIIINIAVFHLILKTIDKNKDTFCLF